jgi:hypothetical protein
VGGEHAAGSHRTDLGGIGDRPGAGAVQEGEGEEGGVALVHVEDGRTVAQRLEQGWPGEAEDGLLTEAVLQSAAVELTRDLSVRGGVLGQRRVQEVDGDGRSADAVHEAPPDADGDRAPAEGDRDSGPQWLQVVLGRPDHGLIVLGAVGLEPLADVAPTPQHGHPDEAQPEVGGRPQMVPG